MESRVVFLQYLLLILASVCEGKSELSHRGKPTLYFLSMLPYPDEFNRTSLQPAFRDGPEVVPAARLAVAQINNRTDILGDYHIELIESDGGCNIDSKALVSFAKEVVRSDRQIVGIVGPGCSDSAITIASLCSHSNAALINVHLGSSPVLADRTKFPNAFTTVDNSLAYGTTPVELMKHNNWNRVAVLYDVTTAVYRLRFQALEREVRKLPDHEITFSAPVFFPDTPVDGLRRSYARIIIALVGFEHINNLLCIVYHENLLFPTYQWVFTGGVSVYNVSFRDTFQGITYQCSAEQLKDALKGVLLIHNELPTYSGPTISGLTVQEYNQKYKENLYDPFSTFDLYYDSVWSLALALNSSIRQLGENTSLSEYNYRKVNITETVREEFYNLNFFGVTGRITYDRNTGSQRRPVVLSQYLIHTGEFPQNVGRFKMEWNISSNAEFLPDSFTTRDVRVSLAAAICALFLAVVITVCIIITHILTAVYRQRQSIKASSTKLNQFIYTGCYLLLFTTVIYSIMKSQKLSQKAHSVFCNVVPWGVNLGLSLILSTVCVKTWRLYDVFVLASRRTKVQARCTDTVLLVPILMVVMIDIVACSIWSFVDPLLQRTKSDIVTHGNTPVVETEYYCKSKQDMESIMIPLLFIINLVLLVCSACLAFLTRRIRMKNFKTTNVSAYIYSLCLLGGIGVPVLLLVQGSSYMNVSFVLLCALLDTSVLFCLSLLLFPPLLPVLLRWYVHLRTH